MKNFLVELDLFVSMVFTIIAPLYARSVIKSVRQNKQVLGLKLGYRAWNVLQML